MKLMNVIKVKAIQEEEHASLEGIWTNDHIEHAGNF